MPGFSTYDPDSRGTGAPVSGVIRQAKHDDLDALTLIELTAITRTREDWQTVIDKAFDDPDRLLLVAEVDGDITGFAQTNFLEKHPVNHGPAGFYLTGVTVIPAYRRRGLGRALTVARLDWIRERANEVWYFASSANQSSIELHLAFGFEEVQRAGTIHGVTFDGGEGILFRASLDGGVGREEILG